MGLLTVLISGVGSGVAKGILNLWLKDENISKEIAKNIVSILASRTTNVIANRKGARQFDEISEKVAENLLPIFESAPASISEDRKIEIAQLVGVATINLKISAELLVTKNLNPKAIEKLLLQEDAFPNQESPLIKYTDEEKRLYKRVVSEASEYMVDIASQLPSFTEHTFAEVLGRQDLILEKANAIFEEVKLIRKSNESSDEQAREFETKYKRAVVRKLDELELFGVDLSGSSKRYKLSTAYVRLAVEVEQARDMQADEDEESDFTEFLSIDQAITRSERLLLRGPAGSGKTTLLKWIAVMAAGHNLSDQLESWNRCVPFFIRLREFSDLDLPRPHEFVALISPSLSEDMPENWVKDKLKAESAIILIDGIDEIIEGQRAKIKEWIADLDHAFPSNKWIVTSRPYAAKKEWLSSIDFMGADLQDMNNQDVGLFIDHWHKAVEESETEADKKAKIQTLQQKLIQTINDNRNLKKLATNPLLCAMICALHRDRSTQLPNGKIELYEACINMFLRRDKEREVALDDYIDIGDPQKRVLLSDFAYWLIRNGWTEVEVDKVDEKLTNKLQQLRDIPDEVTGIGMRRYFVERSSILRQPTIKTIDFPHRTFQEYLAARAINNEGDFGVLSKNAKDDQWREVIQLAVGMARPDEAGKVILELIKLGDQSKKGKGPLYLLAIACLELTIEVAKEITDETAKRLQKIVPPKSIGAANDLAKAGNLVVPYLKYDENKLAKYLTNSVRTLAVIGSKKSLDYLSEYSKDERKGVQKALADGYKHCPDQASYREMVVVNFAKISFSRGMSLEMLNGSIQTNYPSSLNLSLNQISNIEPIKNLQNLNSLDLSSNQISNIEPIKNLQNLNSLDLRSNQIANIEPIKNLQNLKELYLSSNQIANIEPIKNLQNLNYLYLSSNQISNIKPLQNLQNLNSLYLRSNQITNIEPLQNLQNLNSLYLRSNQITNIEPLQNLQNLKYLDLSSNQITNIEPLQNLQNLNHIDLSSNQITNIEPLKNLQNLNSLDLRSTQLSEKQISKLRKALPNLHIIR